MRIEHIVPRGNKFLKDLKRKNKTGEVNSFSFFRMCSTYLGSNPKALMGGTGSSGRDRLLLPEYDRQN